MSESQSQPTDTQMRWVILIILAFIEIVLIGKYVLTSNAPNSLLVSIVIIAGLTMLSPRVFDLKTLNITKEGLEADLNSVKVRLNDTEEKVRQLFLLSMSGDMYQNLKKIESGSFGRYEMHDGLQRELYYLRDIGYIDVPAIRSIPQQGENLSDYVTVKEPGKQFVSLREEMSKRIKNT